MLNLLFDNQGPGAPSESPCLSQTSSSTLATHYSMHTISNLPAFGSRAPDPNTPAAHPLDSVMLDEGCGAKPDAQPAESAVNWGFIDQIVTCEDGEALEEGEVTPETGRGNEQRLSENDDMTLLSVGSASGQSTIPDPRVNAMRSSDTQQARPSRGSLPQPWPVRLNSSAQAFVGGIQPQPLPQQPSNYQAPPYQSVPQQPLPHHPTPLQPMSQRTFPYYDLQRTSPQFTQWPPPGLVLSHQPMPHQPIPHQPLPHQPLPLQPMFQQPLPYSDPQNISLQFTQGSRPSLAFAPRHPRTQQISDGWSIDQQGQPTQAPSHPQLSGQYFFEDRYGVINPGASQLGTLGRHARHMSTNIYNEQSVANPRSPSYSASANQPADTGIPLQSDGRNPATYGSGVGRKSSQSSHKSLLAWGGSGSRPVQPSISPPEGYQFVEFDNGYLTMESKRLSTRGYANAASQSSPGSGRHAADGFRFDCLRATTPEAELFRRAYPNWRDESVGKLKIYLLAMKITVMKKRGAPHDGLPDITAEEIQQFRLQYRLQPALKWGRDDQLQDDQVRPIIQAMKVLGTSLEKLWRHRKGKEPVQSASGSQSVNPAQSSQTPGATRPDDDGYVPEYLLDEFMKLLETSGEAEALRWLRDSKAKAAEESRGSGQSWGSGKGGRTRNRVFSVDDMFNPDDDDDEASAAAFGKIRTGDILIDDDPAAFGIAEIRNGRGQVVYGSGFRRRDNNTNPPALNRTVDIHINVDLVGAAEASAPAVNFFRLMSSDPTQTPKKKKGKN
jgi:hypothetical protein